MIENIARIILLKPDIKETEALDRRIEEANAAKEPLRLRRKNLTEVKASLSDQKTGQPKPSCEMLNNQS
jgi:hypothetical protein